MADFPTINKGPNQIVETNIKHFYKGTTKDNYTISRASNTLTKKQFNISYKVINNSTKETLETFINSNKGSSFNWTHPNTTTYVVIFDEEEISLRWMGNDYWSIDLILKEV